MDLKLRSRFTNSQGDAKAVASARQAPRTYYTEPIPVPETTERNTDSAWALWEDSVAFQDSQDPPDFSDSRASSHAPTAAHTETDTDFDPFSSVSRNGG